jgi:hypothetical protein
VTAIDLGERTTTVMNTIAPAFPGNYGDYADQAPGWGAYHGKHQQRRGTGRVRKPSRRRGVLLEKTARAVSVVAVAFTVGAVLASLVTAGGVSL